MQFAHVSVFWSNLILNMQVNVSISTRDNYCIEVVLRCLAVEGDGLGPHDLNDGGILAAVLAAGFKGNNLPVATMIIISLCYVPFTLLISYIA